MPTMRVTPLPAYDRATQVRVAALSLWLFRMALAPLGLAPRIESLLVVLIIIGVIGALMGVSALWRDHRSAAIGEALATAVALIPAIGWALLSLGDAPTSPADLPWGTRPGWLHLSGAVWLVAIAWTGRQTAGLRTAAVVPAAILLVLDLPPLHGFVFAASPRIAELLAPMAIALAVFALAAIARRLRSPG